MAEHATSIPIPTPVTGRRRLAGGLFAIVAGGTLTSGIAAGFAASVGDFAVADVQLVALCARYVGADMYHVELCAQQDAMLQPITPALDIEWHRLDDLVLEQGVVMLDLEPRIAALPATSPAGVQAKAHAIARMIRHRKDSNEMALLRSLLADLLPAGRA